MPSRQRRFLFLASLLSLALPASASAALVERAAPPAKPTPRIVNGTLASQDEYPAQAGLYFDITGDGEVDALCGGTLVGSRQILTAAHCAFDENDDPLTGKAYEVYLGTLDRSEFDNPGPFLHSVATVEIHPAYDAPSHRNDVAMLTLTDPVDFAPARVVESGDEDLWAPGTVTRIVGWGTTCSSICSSSRFLREANVPIVSDATCGAATSYGSAFDPATMVCAGDSPGTATPHDTCQGDSGGPLYVPDLGSTTADPIFATAGVVSWGIGCANTKFPGIYSRIGQGELNTWTLGNTPRARFSLDHEAVAGEPVTLFSTSKHPDGPSGFTEFRWDLNEDGVFGDRVGSSIAETFPTAEERLVGIEASGPSGDRASFYGVFDVVARPASPAEGGGTPPPTGGGTPPTTLPGVKAKLASFTGPKSVRVKGGGFKVKVRFATKAPTGTARLTVLFKGRKIGSGKVKSKPGGTATTKLKLTKAGLARLKKAGELKVSLRLTLNGSAPVRRSLTLKR